MSTSPKAVLEKSIYQIVCLSAATLSISWIFLMDDAARKFGFGKNLTVGN